MISRVFRRRHARCFAAHQQRAAATVDRRAEGGGEKLEQKVASGSGPLSVAVRDTSRERLFELGPGALADGELLALLLGTGIAGQPARAIAERLLLLGPGLKELARREARELTAGH